MAVRCRIHRQCRAHIGLTCGVGHTERFIVHADVVGRNIEHFGLGAVGRWLLVLGAQSRRANARGVHVFAILGRGILRHNRRPTIGFRIRIHIDARCPVDHRIELFSHQQFACDPVHRIAQTVAIKVRQQLALDTIDHLLGQDVFVDTIVIPLVMRGHLIEPFGHTGIDITCHQGHGPAVVTRTLRGVPCRGVARAIIEQVFVQIGRIPAPRGAATDFPLVAFPCVGAGIRAYGLAQMRGVFRINEDIAVRTHGIGTPDQLACCHIIRRCVAPDTKFTARDTNDDLVLDRQYGRCIGFTNRRIAVLGFPFDSTGVCVQSNDLGIGLMQENLAIGIGNATVDRVTAHHRDHIRVLLGLIFPNDLALVLEVQRIDDVREGRVHVHHVVYDKGRALVSAQNTCRERPRHLQITHVVGVDLVQFGIALVLVVTGLDRPLLGVPDPADEIIICSGHTRAKGDPGSQKQ